MYHSLGGSVGLWGGPECRVWSQGRGQCCLSFERFQNLSELRQIVSKVAASPLAMCVAWFNHRTPTPKLMQDRLLLDPCGSWGDPALWRPFILQMQRGSCKAPGAWQGQTALNGEFFSYKHEMFIGKSSHQAIQRSNKTQFRKLDRTKPSSFISLELDSFSLPDVDWLLTDNYSNSSLGTPWIKGGESQLSLHNRFLLLWQCIRTWCMTMFCALQHSLCLGSREGRYVLKVFNCRLPRTLMVKHVPYVFPKL